MTIRLLSAFDGCPPNSIITLDAANEAGMVTAKTASFDLTGGTPFVPKAGPLEAITGPFTVRARRARTVALQEGKVLKVTGAAGAVGEVTRTGSADKWAVGAGTSLNLGPYSGTQQFPITCTAGSIDATVGDAVVGISSLLGPRNSVVPWGDSITANEWSTSIGATLARDATGTIVTVTLNGHPFMTGMKCRVEQFADVSFNGFLEVTKTGPNTFTYAQVGTPSASTSGGGIRNPYQVTDNGWMGYARFFSGNRIVMPMNAGVGGDTTAKMITRFATEVAPYSPARISIMGGINDIASFGATAAQVFANLQTMYALALSIGASVDAWTILPLEYGYAGNTNAAVDGWNEIIRQVNQNIRLECAKPGMKLIDGYVDAVNPLSATGQPLAGMFSTDHIHPAPKLCALMGKRISDWWNTVIPAGNTLPSSAADNKGSNAANRNLWRSFPSTNTGGTPGSGVTGTVPAAFQVSSSGDAGRVCVASAPASTIADDGDAIGYNCVATFTPNANNDSVSISPNSSGWAASVAVWKAYYLEASIKLTGVVGSTLKSLLFTVTYVVDGINYIAYVLQPSGGTVFDFDLNGVVQTVPFFLHPISGGAGCYKH